MNIESKIKELTEKLNQYAYEYNDRVDLWFRKASFKNLNRLRKN